MHEIVVIRAIVYVFFLLIGESVIEAYAFVKKTIDCEK